ncbi:MAG: hypothetical protein U1E76_01255 [Planctomycetota bacterium]
MRKLILVVVALGWLPLACLGGDKDAQVKLPEGDLKTFRSATEKIVDLLSKDKTTDFLAEQLKLKKLVDDFQKKNKWSPLADTESWSNLIYEAMAPDKLPKEWRAVSDFMQKPIAMSDKAFKDKEYLLSIPKDYKPDKKFPVLELLHPKLTGAGQLADRVRDWATKAYPKEIRDQFIVVVPIDKPDKAGDRDPEWASLQGKEQVMGTLNEGVLFNLSYDPRRLYLDGDGDSVRFATFHPSIFAGIICRGAPPDGLWGENLGNTAVLIVGSAEDAKKAEQADISPLLGAKNVADNAGVLAWLKESPAKNVNPMKIKHRTADSSRGANFWLDADVDAVDAKTPLGEYPSYEAEANRETNEIIIKCSSRVRTLRVYLNDQLADLDKPVKIIVNGTARYEGKVARDLRTMFECCYKTNSNANIGAVYVDIQTISVK